MVDTAKAAQTAARKAIEATYFGTLTVTEIEKVKDASSGLTRSEPKVVLEGQPCRLSFETLKAAGGAEPVSAVAQVAKLFVSPDVKIGAGAKITVEQDGRTTDYARSGIPAVYGTHQEIVLELFERWV